MEYAFKILDYLEFQPLFNKIFKFWDFRKMETCLVITKNIRKIERSLILLNFNIKIKNRFSLFEF